MIGKKKLDLFGVGLSLLLMLVGLSSFALAKVATAAPKADWTTYTLEKEFTISTPASWRKLNNSYLKLQVSSGREALLNIGTMPMPEGVSTLDELVKSIKDSLKNMPGLQGEIINAKFQGKGWVGEEFKYSRATQDPEDKNVVIFCSDYLIVVGKSYYMVEIGSLKEKEAEYTTIFQDMIKSFQLLKK